MGDAQPFSEWIIRLVIAGIFSIIGFLSKQIYVDWKAKKNQKKTRLDQLRILSNLLNESKSIYVSQNFMSQRLMQMLRENHPRMSGQQLGYDETFYRMHSHFLPAESELQAIIRSTTMNSMLRVNQEMSEWLQLDKVFKSIEQPSKEKEVLAEQLRLLEDHLNLWHDKYKANIPGEIKRSLIYLADEKGHGLKFPQDLRPAVDKVIETWPK